MKLVPVIVAIALIVFFLSSFSYPRLMTLPYDSAGRSLNSPYTEHEPQVSGDYMVFISDRNGSQDVYLYDLVNRKLIDLPGLNSVDSVASHPGVSADGRYIVFAASHSGEVDIYRYDRQVRRLQNLTANLDAEVRNPTISGDGNKIALESNANGQWDIVLYDRSDF